MSTIRYTLNDYTTSLALSRIHGGDYFEDGFMHEVVKRFRGDEIQEILKAYNKLIETDADEEQIQAFLSSLA